MPSNQAREFFENCLQGKIDYNTEHHAAPSETALARRLLARGLELKGMYDTAYSGLRDDDARRTFLDCCVLGVGLCWTDSDGKQAREDKKRLEELNAAIAEQADDLSRLLEQRERLNNQSAVTTDAAYHIIDIFDQANPDGGLYQSFLREPLDGLRGRFDLKYWPKLADVVQAIGEDAARAEVKPADPLTAAMCESTRSSKADVVRAIQASVADNKHGGMGCLPRSFKLTDEALASLAGVLLDLPADAMVDAKYVKNIGKRSLKQREG